MIYLCRNLLFAAGSLFLMACGTENTNPVEQYSGVQVLDTVALEEAADSDSIERGPVALESPVRAEVTGTYVLEVLDARSVRDPVDTSRVPEAPPGFYKAQARLVDSGSTVYFYVPGGTQVMPGALVELYTREGRYFLQEPSEE